MIKTKKSVNEQAHQTKNFLSQNILFSALGFFFYMAGGGLLIDRYNGDIYDDQSESIDRLAARGLAAGSLMVLQGLLMFAEALFGTIDAFKNR